MINVVGIVPEQHPDRTRLFMQWKQMNWPVMIDPLNLLDVEAVPVTLLIDEQGSILSINPSAMDFQQFAGLGQPSSTVKPEPAVKPSLEKLAQDAESGTAKARIDCADGLFLWGGEARLDEAISWYRQAVKSEPFNSRAHFKLGVALRRRAETEKHQPEDFAEAVAHWRRALEINPNQYIWRRRIQQFGPRLDKPYSFYDWVNEARKEIIERGETPVELNVEPSGAEFAFPESAFTQHPAELSEPDPDGRIARDQQGLISPEVVVVPSTGEANPSWRVHVSFAPNAKLDAHWNNEAEDTLIWVDPPESVTVDQRGHRVAIPPQPVSDETRRIEFEVQLPGEAADPVEIPVYALCYVCEGVNGTCLYRRVDLTAIISSPEREAP
ncbi:MAG: hypothetical protein JSU96_17590 [Acidobacteriota bacterium]|nr:MAG: hypothetical protein JSU96_17590 [Acidobacteriota bacterium]